MNKEYTFDDVLKKAGAGGTLDKCLSELQDLVYNLEIKTKQLEESFHGEGPSSSIHDAYKVLFEYNIGDTNYYGSYWWTITQIVKLANMIYDNALTQKNKDTSV